jgi:hypothetical protein
MVLIGCSLGGVSPNGVNYILYYYGNYCKDELILGNNKKQFGFGSDPKGMILRYMHLLRYQIHYSTHFLLILFNFLSMGIVPQQCLLYMNFLSEEDSREILREEKN